MKARLTLPRQGLLAAVVIALPAVFNVAGVTSVLPLDGVPLPFMSAGGSNMLVLLAMVGIVVSIARAGDRAHDAAQVRRPVVRRRERV